MVATTQVTVPIKIRAIYKGLLTGYADISLKHDNSWWESFGGSKTAQVAQQTVTDRY